MAAHHGWEAVATLAKWAGQELRKLEADVAAWQARAVRAEGDLELARAVRVTATGHGNGWPADILLLTDQAGVRFLVDPGKPDGSYIDVVLIRPEGRRPYCAVTSHDGEERCYTTSRWHGEERQER